MTKSIDEWAAAKCGVEITDFNPCEDEHVLFWEHNNVVHSGDWSIEKEDCRLVVREQLKIYTIPATEGWMCVTDYNIDINVKGKTIAESEIACITAIYEAEK